jgi:hypothetical protein
MFSRYLRYGILEDIDTTRHIQVGRFCGVRVTVTSLTWLSPFVFLGLCLALGLGQPFPDAAARLGDAALATIVIELATAVHAIGHIFSGQAIGSPMDELLITATRGVNLYDGPQEIYPPSIHIGRSLGGPLFNLVIAGVARALLPILPGGWATQFATTTISINLFFGLGSLLPLPSVDGQVIWRELFR